MRNSVWLVLLLALALGIAEQAWAYRAETGNRAPDTGGWDIVHHRYVRLSDYLGKWLLVDFTAMWCGPCNRDRPEFLKQVKPYIERGDLAVIMVSADTSETLPKLKELIKEYKIDFPVLYDGGEFDSIPIQEWCRGDTLGFGVPAAFLINPQGVVVSRDISSGILSATLEFYLQAGRPVIGIRSRHCRNDDGTFTFCVDVMNPTRDPIEVHMAYYWENWLCDPDDPSRITTEIKSDCSFEYAASLLAFDEFGEATYQVTVEPDPAKDIIGYYFYFAFPGSRGAPGFGDAGFNLFTGNQQAFLPGIKWNGEHVHRLA